MIYKIYKTTNEHFFPVNAFDIPNPKIDYSKDELDKLNKIFDSYNNNNKINNIQFEKTRSLFKSIPYYSDKNTLDNLNGQIKDYLKVFIDKLIGTSIDVNLDLVKDIYNISFNSDKTEIIFNIDMINTSRFYVEKLVVYMYIGTLSGFYVKYIYPDSTLESFAIRPYDSLNDTFYRIKNKLYLMDPFLTSGKELRIEAHS